jgi:hypothetical protein
MHRNATTAGPSTSKLWLWLGLRVDSATFQSDWAGPLKQGELCTGAAAQLMKCCWLVHSSSDVAHAR